MLIQEQWVHEAVAYLRDESDAAAAAKGNLVRADYHRKRIRAQLILDAPHTTHGMREAWAEAHKDYAEICEKLAKCEEESEKHHNSRNRADTICRMWQTQQATLRGLRVA